jgi:hypothetical protein
MNISLGLAWLPFIGAVNQADQITQIYHHRRHQPGMLNLQRLSWVKTIKTLV